MNFDKNGSTYDSEKKIYFSQTIKAGKRIYYLDVKKNRRDELFLSITESKKVYMGDIEEGQYSFEKHKIFLYQEDFGKFIDALSNAIRYIHDHSDAPQFLSDDYYDDNDTPSPGEDSFDKSEAPHPAADDATTAAQPEDVGTPLNIDIDF